MTAKPIIEASRLSKIYGTGEAAQKVLDDVSFTMAAGEHVALVGKSGSGKSTLLNIVGGLDRRFSGEAKVLGQDIRALSDKALSQFRNAQLGFVFQQFNLLEHLTLAENVALPARFAKKQQENVDGRIQQVLEQVSMASRKDDLVSNLSGGQKQRVAIARALYNKPELLLCDEPTGNLDTETGEQIIELFRRLNQDDGIALLVVTHELNVCEAAGRVLTLRDGKLVDAGDTAERGG